MREKKTLAVAGTHGKTTTSSLLVHVLKQAGIDPSYAVGGILENYHSNGDLGKGDYFVAEADESDGSFLKYAVHGGILTNIEAEHLDYYKTEEAMNQSFQKFIDGVENSELFFWCGDEATLREFKPKGLSYGFSEGCTVKGSRLRYDGAQITLDVEHQGKLYTSVEVALLGKHNALNALSVFGLALQLGVPEASIRESFKSFEGVARRCEVKGRVRGVCIIDDYAHHPTEIERTLNGLRHSFEERKIISVFQPHRYSRTENFMHTYPASFQDADEVVVTDIYATGETPIEGVSSQILVERMQEELNIPVHYVPRNVLVAALTELVRPHDLVVTMGAGDVTRVGKDLALCLEKLPPKKYTVGVVCGGRSLEHEISLRSVKHILSGLSPEYYDVKIFGISKRGHWDFNPNLNVEEIEEHSRFSFSLGVLREIEKCDLFYPMIHGPFGEDGKLQGFFEIVGKPYVGCDSRSASICMDKITTKKLALYHKIPTSPFLEVNLDEWRKNPDQLLELIGSELSYPLFVKPPHLGSSVGVYKVKEPSELAACLEKAFAYDSRLLVEQGVEGRELEFAIQGNEYIKVPHPGEILSDGKVYDYDQKYKAGGMSTEILPHFPEGVLKEGKALAKKAYQTMGCEGMARVDFFLDRENRWFLNEINPIPGFTSISIFPKVWEARGVNAAKLNDRLIILALHRSRQKAKVIS